MGGDFFTEVPGRIPFGGLDSTDPLAFKVYQPDRVVLGKRMEDHLRIAVCLWHSFNWPGSDVFGVGHLRPALARPRPRPDGRRAREARRGLRVPREARRAVLLLPRPRRRAGGRDVRRDARPTSTDGRRRPRRTWPGPASRLLWGTANLFSHPRYAAGAATNPDPEVFAYAAAQVKLMLEATQRLGGANYVLWGGREGYETLLNTDLAREEQPARPVPARWSPSTSTRSASRGRS